MKNIWKWIAVIELLIIAIFSCQSQIKQQLPDVNSTLERVDNVIEKMDLTRDNPQQWHEIRGALAECRATIRVCLIHQ